MKAVIQTGPQIWQLEGTQMEVEVILASQGPASCPPIYTLRLRYPRIIHAEVKTHRVFTLDAVEHLDWGFDIMGDQDLSRNARSSRAVPVKTMLDEIRNAPFVPWHWGKNQKGMQAGEECNAPVDDWWTPTGTVDRTNAWCQAAIQAINAAESFSKAGYHKQIVNRLLEPFMWIDTLITSTEWLNFLWLRDHKDAEPHLQDLARLVQKAIDGATVQTLEPGQWHLPYITQEDWLHNIHDPTYDFLQKISAARCARISYAPFDGDASYERELERYNSLVSSDRVHASPLEHQATPDIMIEGHIGPYGEWRVDRWQNAHLHGNLTGYIQFRKTVPGENHAS